MGTLLVFIFVPQKFDELKQMTIFFLSEYLLGEFLMSAPFRKILDFASDLRKSAGFRVL